MKELLGLEYVGIVRFRITRNYYVKETFGRQIVISMELEFVLDGRKNVQG